MRYPDFAHAQSDVDGRTYMISIVINNVGARSRSPQLLLSALHIASQNIRYE